MPSGNAIYTYTGPEESTEVQGQIFLKDQPKHITDQGVIAACATREDFDEQLVLVHFFAPAGEDLEVGDPVWIDNDGKAYKTPAKPKKAKSK